MRSNWSFGNYAETAPPQQLQKRFPPAQKVPPAQKKKRHAGGEPVNQTNAIKVLEFTTQTGTPCPSVPQMMNPDEVNFITKMILDELLELLATTYEPEDAKNLMISMVEKAKSVPRLRTPDQHELIGEQADAFVDIWYYSLNAAAKKGINLSKIFDLVHHANMAKRDPKTGRFLRRADGKIIKPAGWKAPDVTAAIRHQAQNGSWGPENSL